MVALVAAVVVGTVIVLGANVNDLFARVNWWGQP